MLRSPTANTEMAAMDSSYSVAKTKPVKVEEKKKKIKKLVDFENVCHENPNKGYAFHTANIYPLTNVDVIKNKLIGHLMETITALESRSSRRIARIYIGKTFYFSERKHSSKDGTYKRWMKHSTQRYGRDGMVILGEFTRETVDRVCNLRTGKNKKHEQFALAMEQMLLHHYLLFCPDPRVANKTFNSGSTTRKKKEKP